MGSASMVVVDVRGEHAAQMAFVGDYMWSRHSRRIEPITRSTYAFCHGERGARDDLSDAHRRDLSGEHRPYEASRSRSRNLGAVSHGNASIT